MPYLPHHRAPLDDGERSQLAAVADWLIPSGARMPSASEAEVHLAGVDTVIGYRPDLLGPLKQAIDDLAAMGSLDDGLDRWSVQHADRFTVLATVVANAYFLNDRVRSLIGYAGQEYRPVTEADIDEHQYDDLLAPVRRRGAIYRPCHRRELDGEARR